MTAPAPASRRSSLVPLFLLGWGAGALLVVLVRLLGTALLPDPCRGHAVLALLTPLLLGPGGLALTATNWGRPRRAALGLGLVVASFVPALAVGARDIGVLRATGCAGGYVVIAPAGGRSVSEVNVRAGESLELTLRIGGYSLQSHPGPFALRAASSVPTITLALPRTSVRVGEVVPLRLTVAAGTPPNTYTVGVRAVQRQGRQTFAADGALTVTVRP